MPHSSVWRVKLSVTSAAELDLAFHSLWFANISFWLSAAGEAGERLCWAASAQTSAGVSACRCDDSTRRIAVCEPLSTDPVEFDRKHPDNKQTERASRSFSEFMLKIAPRGDKQLCGCPIR